MFIRVKAPTLHLCVWELNAERSLGSSVDSTTQRTRSDGSFFFRTFNLILRLRVRLDRCTDPQMEMRARSAHGHAHRSGRHRREKTRVKRSSNGVMTYVTFLALSRTRTLSFVTRFRSLKYRYATHFTDTRCYRQSPSSPRSHTHHTPTGPLVPVS